MDNSSIKTYLVGGAVRDFLLCRVPEEFDYAFTGDIASFTAANPAAKKVGKSIEGLILHGLDFMPLRGADIAEDLRARDFTINALALEENGILHAHETALADLKAKILRPASPNAIMADPLRVFRAARFLAQFPDFEAHTECLEQMREAAKAGVLAKIPAERVGRELLKALKAPKPSRFLHLLADTGCLSPWFAELKIALELPAGPAPWHNNSVFEHTCDIIDALAAKSNTIKPAAIWMGLAHDLGKVESPRDNLPHHYGHEVTGVKIALQLAERLALPKKLAKAGALASRQHMKAGQYDKLRPGTRCDMLMEIHKAGIDLPFWQLADADSGRDISVKALRELKIILAVPLPEEIKNQGEQTAQRLRTLRCEALAALGK